MRKEDTLFIYYSTIGLANILVISSVKQNELYKKY